MKVCFLLYTVILYTEIHFSFSKSLFNNRDGRLRMHYLDDVQKQPLIRVDDLQYAMPFRYQRVYPSMYFDAMYQPHRRYRYMDEREPFHYDPYQKSYAQNENYELRRPYAYGTMRPLGYIRQPLKFAAKDDLYLDPQFNQNPSKLENNDRGYIYSDVNEFADEGSKVDKKSAAENSKFKSKRETIHDILISTEPPVVENAENDAKVADELRDILDYMGLIDEENNPGAEKMEDSVKMVHDPAIIEDENMENDSNNIALVTENLGKNRKKREKSARSTEDSTTADNHIAVKDATEKVAEAEDKNIKEHGDEEKLKKDNLVEENEQNVESLKSNSEEENTEDYEKIVEKQIQTKINALKDEVKREIAALKAQEAAQAVHSFNEDGQRKKRHAETTLLDGENINIDPSFHPEEEMKPKVRRRRQVDDKDIKFMCGHSGNQKDCSLCKKPIEKNQENENLTEINNNKREIVPLINVTNATIQNSGSTLKLVNLTSTNSGNSRQLIRRKRDAQYNENSDNNGVSNINVATYNRDESEFDEENENIDDTKNYDSFYDVPGLQREVRESHQDLLNPEAIRGDYGRFYDGHIMNKRSLPGLYQDTSNLYDRYYYLNPRQKRDDYENLIAFHSGGPATNHASNIKTRSMAQLNGDDLRFAKFKRSIKNDATQPQQLTDMSDTEIFGALSQGYDGELSRFKRVKRTNVKN